MVTAGCMLIECQVDIGLKMSVGRVGDVVHHDPTLAFQCYEGVIAAANATDRKMKKTEGAGSPALEFAENPDILKTVSQMSGGRPGLVVGFAAETNDVEANATAKRARKGCDWIVANDVSPATGIMGGSENKVAIVTADGVEDWPRLSKDETARRLAARIAEALTR